MNKTSKKARVKNQSISAESANHSNKQGAVIHLIKPPFLKTPSYLAVILASCVFGAEYAQAACNTIASGTYYASVICMPASGDATVTTQPNTMINIVSDSGISVTSFTGAASLNLNDTSVINNGSGYGIMSSAQNTTGSSSIKLTGDNTITMNSVDALSAVWAQSGSDGQAGATSIDVTGTLNITNHGLNYYRLAAGLAVMDTTSGPGASSNLSIQHQGSGTISTLSSPAIYARSYADHADIDIGVGTGVVLDVTRSSIYDSYQNSAAIGVEARSATGLTTVDNAGTILLRGNGNGINLHTAGDIDIRNTGAISGINPTAGQGYFSGILADANYSSPNARHANIDNSGAITVTGTGAQLTAIEADVYNGSINIANRGAITADNGTGIIAQITNYMGAGDITISSEAPISFGSNGRGISATNAGSGNVTVTGSGDIYSGSQTNSWANGIQASANQGDISVNYSGDLSVSGSGIQAIASNGDAKIDYTGDSLLLNGDYGGYGVYASALNVEIENTAAIQGIGQGAIGIGAYTARYDDSDANLIVHNQGNITLVSGTGIQAGSYGIAQVDVVNSGDISISGDSGRGLSFQASGPTDGNISNSGNITTTGQNSDGIHIEQRSRDETDIPGHLETHNSGTISTIDDQSSGIKAISYGHSDIGVIMSSLPADIIIHNQAAISTMGAQSHGISAIAELGTTSVLGNILITNSDNISVHGFTKQIDDYYGPITLADSDGINATAASGNISISNTASGVISAGAGTGISLSGATQNIDNAGLIDALSDHAVQFDHTLATTTQVYDYDTGTYSNVTTYSLGTTGNATLNNSGVITGLINASESTVNMDNSGQWNLRNFNDSDHDGVRDTLSVAVSDFGNSSNNQINNSGTLTLAGDEDAATTLNNAGEYSTGYTANTMALGGATQGQILGVNTFTNSGIIDLSSNNTVGDVLIVSGSHSRHSRWWGLCGQWRTTQNQYGFE